jgi:hypothetical protein
VSRAHVIFDPWGEVTDYVLGPPAEDARRGWRAMMLAPTIEICQALLRGESVPVDELRPEWVKRFGRRPR